MDKLILCPIAREALLPMYEIKRFSLLADALLRGSSVVCLYSINVAMVVAIKKTFERDATYCKYVANSVSFVTFSQPCERIAKSPHHRLVDYQW